MDTENTDSTTPGLCTVPRADGGQCRGRNVLDGRCAYHRRTDEERAAFHAAGAARSAAGRAATAEERSTLLHAARLGSDAAIARVTLERGEAFASRLERIALGDDDGMALRALQLLFDRAYGRPTQRLEDASAPPARAEWDGMSLEERRRLLAALEGR